MNRVLRYFWILSYWVILLYAVLFSGERSEIRSRSVNLYPVRQRLEELHKIRHHHFANLMDFIFNIFGNVILFLPFPAVVWQLFPNLSPKSVIGLAFLVSVTIEGTQFVFERGIADIDDIALNTAGAIVGVIVYKIYLREKTMIALRPAAWR